MTKEAFVKGTVTTKKGKEIVVAGTHVFNVVACVAAITLVIVMLQWWRTGEQPQLEIVLCLLPAVMGGSYNVVKWLQTRR
ncbi:hypothetical protein AB6M97_02940 [Streptococcus hillyeri]|uniref:Uncharacterized protein n=1 Tax=Streptococcus hillyeri TaxID=2282420 RepID=A0A3L9DVC4_9STRE|nr:hypothetical protein [Streptococcus hillyeri]RLY04188.1 hypothetical protein EAF07_03720 [Streptococcus hillyeri]